jgi:hypothetical protein
MSWHIAIYLVLAVAFGVNLGIAFMAILAARGEDAEEVAAPRVTRSPMAQRGRWGFAGVGGHRMKDRNPRASHGHAMALFGGRLGRRLPREIA